MATPRGYSSYRGRTPRWKILLIILLLLVIAAAVFFLVIQKYLVYDASGRPYLELPSQETAASSSAASSQEELPNITIEKTPAASLQAAQLAETPLTDWAAIQSELASRPADVSAAVVTMKDASGTVYYDSAAAKAVSSHAVKTADGTQQAIGALTASDTYAVARLSCLLDPIAANAKLDGMGLKNTGGYLFYDGNNQNWLDPSKADTTAYLAALAKECAALGFDEILLTDLSYPTVGKLDKIAYGTEDRSAALCALVSAVRSALDAAGYDGIKLSVELPAAVITAGSDDTSGLTVSALAPLVDRVYTVTMADAATALEQALADDAQAAQTAPGFLPELSGAPGDCVNYVLLP